MRSRNSASPGTPLGVVCYFVPCVGTLSGRSSDLQASYSLLLPGSGLNQCLSELSFLFTAAGQFRTLTGFPFQPTSIIRHHKVPRI